MNIQIALEGCDRVGKSTLALKLASHFKADIKHIVFQKTESSDSKYQCDFMYDYNLSLVNLAREKHCLNTITIFDRYIYGEWVYGKLRGYEAEYLFNDPNFLLPGNILTVFVDADEATLVDRFDDKIHSIDSMPLFLKRFREAYLNAQTPNKLLLYNDFNPSFFNNAINIISNVWGDILYE